MNNERTYAYKTTIVLPVSGVLLLPDTDATLRLGKIGKRQKEAFQERGRAFLAVPLQKGKGTGSLELDDFYQNGVAFTVNRVVEEEAGISLMVHITNRVELKALYEDQELLTADYLDLEEKADLDAKSSEEMLQYLKRVVHEICQNFRDGEQFSKAADSYGSIPQLMVYLSQFMPLSEEDRYALLKTDSLRERSLTFIDYLLRQKEIIKLNMQMNEKFSERANRFYREQALRQQLKVIQEELHEGGENEAEEDGYYARIEHAGMPEEIKKAALEEANKLETGGREGAEQNIIRNYLEFMLQLPWSTEPLAPIDLQKARQVLDDRHYGLKKVKARIVQHLAVMQLKNETKGSALLLVGPPGTGKTSLGKSIAEALGRKYSRMSLGGVRDEAEIRGHRRTYVGAMAGRVLQGVKRAGTMNPVIVLDEIDKLTQGGLSGDPSSALLEVLDPEQNNTFTDHYLDLPYDLSNVFFIATANSLDGIPAPLLDRMETIEISGYTPEEKFHIAREHLLPMVLEENGIHEQQMVLSDELLRKIIEDYTREAGVRGLKKQLASLARTGAERILSDEQREAGAVQGAQREDVNRFVYTVTAEELENALGRKVSHHEKAQQDNPPGVVTGLAWTPVGGEILFIETTDMPGSGEVILTGQLGDVMKESARISLSLLKSRLPLNAVNFKERDLHIHVPSGAVPKDGPSAGIALFTALASLITGRRVDPQLAMTGEITLRGEVTPIGGLKEKLYGAQRAGIKKVLIPVDNEQDLKDVPEEILEELTVIPVKTVEDVMSEALGIHLPRMEHVLFSLSEGQLSLEG